MQNLVDDDGFLVNSLYEYKAAILWKNALFQHPRCLFLIT